MSARARRTRSADGVHNDHYAASLEPVWCHTVPDTTGNVSGMPPIPLSVLDPAPITLGSTPGDALRNSLDLVRHAERLGYRRHWVAEHHNMPGIASAATAVVAGYLAAGTSTIRIGAGGIMLPNHSPLVIAEQFGTLEALYPGRIDLGLGRAPGTDQLTARALRRGLQNESQFPHDVQDLQALFAPAQPGQSIQAVPGAGLEVPLWILGSSTYGARLAALLGLPYAFASHFAPTDLLPALHRQRFQRPGHRRRQVDKFPLHVALDPVP